MGSKSAKEYVVTVGKDYICPSCQQSFPSKTPINEINEHSIICANTSIVKQTKNFLYEDINFIDIDNYLDSKYSRPKSFDDKVNDFRKYINSIKINWTLGCDTLHIRRDKALVESMEKIKNVNLRKELKIDFMGEVSQDAGGIIREWFTVIINELELKEMGLFQRSDCDEFSFILDNNLKGTPQTLQYFEFLGKLIAKALIDNITINLCFNKMIYKMLIDEPISFEDLKYIDAQLYLSLCEIKKIDPSFVTEMCLYYVYEYYDEKNSLITENLIPNGDTVLVKDIEDYIQKRIAFLIKKNVVYIDALKKGITHLIVQKELAKFNSSELELVINGKPFIDLNEWRTNSEYRGKYHKTHYVILWFWEALSKQSQEKLSKFLQFCTGTSRVPVSGFEKLESNREEIAKFCINPVKYNSYGSNFIKAHTCFNRIDLPIYKKQYEVDQAIEFVLNNEIIGFGID